MNHLEAQDHCPTSRGGLRERMKAEGLSEKVLIPEDGEELHFQQSGASLHPRPKARSSEGPGFQKWVTARFTGT